MFILAGPEILRHVLSRGALYSEGSSIQTLTHSKEVYFVMNRKASLTTLLQTSLVAISSVVLASFFVSEQRADGQSRVVNAERRWEYCTAQAMEVYGRGNDRTIGVASVCHLRASGAQCVRLETAVDGPLEKSAARAGADSLAKVVSELGQNGWEMVGEGLGPGDKNEKRSLYFRRTRRD
jgi:hypothetical protein